MDIDSVLTKSQIEKYTSQGFWENKTLCDYLDEAVRRYPEKVAIVDRKNRVTYSELNCWVLRFAFFLLELGVKKGDIVSVQLPGWSEFGVIHCALSRIGVVTNPIAPYYRKKELEYFIKKSGAVGLVIPDHFRNYCYTKMVKSMLPNLPELKHVIVVGEEVPEGMISYNEAMKDEKEKRYSLDDLAQFRPDCNEAHVLMFTSGTEAEPKGVVHTHNTYGNATRNILESIKLTDEDTFFMAAPVTHTTGIRFGVRLPIMLGSKVVLQDIFDPEEALRLIAREKCTLTVGATPFLHSMIYASNLEEVDNSSLRIFLCGGAPIPRELVKEGEKRLGCRVLAGFGSTESPSQTLNRLDDPLEKIYGTDGYPVAGVELKIVDDHNREQPNGEVGEAVCRGPQLFIEYYKDPKITKKSFDKDGFFFTGDLCMLDKDGYLKIVGRKKDVIIRGGLNISTGEIEDALLTHPKVKSVAIVGMPDPRLGERICAYIVPEADGNVTIEEVTNFLRKKGVAVIKLPERIERIDSLPMTQSGKVRKNVLREDISRKLVTRNRN